MPTWPLDPGRVAAHSIVSYPSWVWSSAAPGPLSHRYTPSDAYRPRVSCTTTMYPRRASAAAVPAYPPPKTSPRFP